MLSVVLDAALKHPEVREAAAEAGIRTAGDVAQAELAVQRAREALGTIFTQSSRNRARCPRRSSRP